MSLRDLDRPQKVSSSRARKEVPQELSPYRDIPYKEGPGGVCCRWCGDHKRIDLQYGLCKTCIDIYTLDKMKRCIGCGEPSSRPRVNGLCQPCVGRKFQIPQNLEAMVKARYIGICKA